MFNNNEIRQTMNNKIISFIADHVDSFIVHLYPAIDPKLDGRIEEMIARHAEIFFKEEVRLTRRGLINCKKVSYSKQGDWIGSLRDGFAGLRKHAKKSIRGNSNPTRVYIVTAKGIDEMIALKAEIRELIGKGTWPIHITDTQDEALTLARIYFNPNALLACNGRSHVYDSSVFDARIDELKCRLEKAGLPLDGMVGAGSTPFGVTGIRVAKDFDYLAIDSRYDDVLHDEIFSPHDSQLRRYPFPKEQLINDPDKHFYYRGIKFISLDVLAAMKKKRHEWPKDWKDYFRVKAFKAKTRMLLALSAWRYIV